MAKKRQKIGTWYEEKSRDEYLSKLIPEGAIKKHYPAFCDERMMVGQMYFWMGHFSHSSREVLLMGVLEKEGIPFRDSEPIRAN